MGSPLSVAEGVGHRGHPVYAHHVAYTMYNECKLAIARVQMGSIKMYVGSTRQILDVQKGSQGKIEASNTFVLQEFW